MEFNPGIGFVRLAGVQGINGELLYGWIPGENSKFFNYSINVRGERYTRLEDGKLESMMIFPELEINTKKGVHAELAIEIQGEGVLHDFNLSDRVTNNSLDIHSVNLKALYMLNTKLSATLLVQYVNTENDFIANSRLRYNPREGNDFYLVYKDYRSISGRNLIPETPRFFNKTIMVKYIHTFIL